jgi:hypothetical protein
VRVSVDGRSSDLGRGYSGANNTGAEALLRADIEDLRAVLGKDLRITIPALNPANLRRYIPGGPDLEIVPLPSSFFGTIRKLVHEADVVVLVRRPVVLRRFAREVDALYEEGPGSSDGIHVGAAPREGAIA